MGFLSTTRSMIQKKKLVLVEEVEVICEVDLVFFFGLFHWFLLVDIRKLRTIPSIIYLSSFYNYFIFHIYFHHSRQSRSTGFSVSGKCQLNTVSQPHNLTWIDLCSYSNPFSYSFFIGIRFGGLSLWTCGYIFRLLFTVFWFRWINEKGARGLFSI